MDEDEMYEHLVALVSGMEEGFTSFKEPDEEEAYILNNQYDLLEEDEIKEFHEFFNKVANRIRNDSRDLVKTLDSTEYADDEDYQDLKRENNRYLKTEYRIGPKVLWTTKDILNLTVQDTIEDIWDDHDDDNKYTVISIAGQNQNFLNEFKVTCCNKSKQTRSFGIVRTFGIDEYQIG